MDPSKEVVDHWTYVSILLPPASLLVNVGAQVFLFRMRKGTHFLRSVAGGFLTGLAALALFEFWMLAAHDATGGTLAGAILVNTPVYFCLSYCYFIFINLGQASIRIRIYSEIARTAGGIRMESILEEYNEPALARVRLERLFESGDLVRDSAGMCHVGRRRLLAAAIPVFALKKFLLGKRSEFE